MAGSPKINFSRLANYKNSTISHYVDVYCLQTNTKTDKQAKYIYFDERRALVYRYIFQAEGKNSDTYLHPVKIYPDPFRWLLCLKVKS